jgi:copper transport protein
MQGRRRWKVVIASLLLAAGATAAWAHATLVRSDPTANSRLAWPPARLKLEFNEAVAARTSRVELIGPDSQRLGLALQRDSTDRKILLAEVPSLSRAGRYRVEWRLVGPDGHAVNGQFAFTIDSIPSRLDPASTAGETVSESRMREPSIDTALQRGVRVLSYLSMVILIGSIAFALFVLPSTARADAEAVAEFGVGLEHRMRSLAFGGASALLILAFVRLTNQGLALSGSFSALRPGDLADLLGGSTWGRGWMLQVGATTALLFGLRATKPMRWSALAIMCIVLAISASFLGHPAAVSDVAGLAMSVNAFHVLAAGGWVGAIIVLVFAALPLIRSMPNGYRVETARRLLRAFSPLALSCAAILAVTGAIGGWLQLRKLEFLLGSDYGQVLFRKVMVVLAIAALGAYHWRVVQPAVGTDRSLRLLRGSLVLDVALVLLVLVLTAILTSTAPPLR